MIRHCSFLMVVIIWILFSVGCACKYSRLEMNYGTSFSLAKFNQILNPETEKDLKPSNGLDGQVAMEVMEKYRKGFEEQTTAPTYTFNLK